MAGDEFSDAAESLPAAKVASARRTMGERLVDFATRRSGLAVVVVVANLISSIAIITAFGFAAVHRWQAWEEWQRPEESSIESLQAGYSIQFFESRLGTPIIDRAISNGYTEDVFKDRGFYVEALTSGGTPEVKYFETVVCDASIRPRIVLPGTGVVTLNVSTFASVTASPQIDYNFGEVGLDGLPYMREYAYGGTIGAYRTFEWGINASCTPSAPFTGIPVMRHLNNAPVNPAAEPTQLRWVRAHAVANEFAMTAPNVSLATIPPSNLAVDHITVSLANPPQSRPRPISPITVCSEQSRSGTQSPISPCGGP